MPAVCFPVEQASFSLSFLTFVLMSDIADLSRVTSIRQELVFFFASLNAM